MANKKNTIYIIIIIVLITVIGILIILWSSVHNKNKFSDYVVEMDPIAAQNIADYDTKTTGELDYFSVYEYDEENKYGLNNDDKWARGAATSALTHFGCENVIEDFYDGAFYVVVFEKEGSTYSIIVDDVCTHVTLLGGHYSPD